MEHRGRPKKDGLIKLQNKILKAFDDSLRETAEEVSFRIESLYESAIQAFYESYDPIYYIRTLSTYQGSNRYDNPFEYMKFGDKYFSGIQVDSSNIPGNPYRAHKNWVFDRTFYKGIHGFVTVDKPKINKRKNELGYRIKIKNFPPRMRGERISHGENYTMKHGTANDKALSPKNLMDAGFRQNIAKKGKIDEIFKPIMDKNLKKLL